jgi:hypothetical protein
MNDKLAVKFVSVTTPNERTPILFRRSKPLIAAIAAPDPLGFLLPVLTSLSSRFYTTKTHLRHLA